MKTLVVSYAESGAYHLAHWLKHSVKISDCDFLLSRQAAHVFSRVIPGVKPLNSRSVNFELLHLKYHQIICSVSRVKFEKLTLVRGIATNMETCVILDNWDDYEERLSLSGKLLVPDKLLVCDDEAECRARQIRFPRGSNVTIERVRNYYFDAVTSEIVDLTRCFFRKPHTTHIFYLSEALPAGHTDALEILRRTLKFLVTQSRKTERLFVVRIAVVDLELRDRHQQLVNEYQRTIDVDLTEASSVAEDCAWADWVVGCRDTSLVVAANAGKKVYSVLPPALASSALPHSGIKMLFRGF